MAYANCLFSETNKTTAIKCQLKAHAIAYRTANRIVKAAAKCMHRVIDSQEKCTREERAHISK